MKSFKEFLNEDVPTNHANTAGYSGGFGGDGSAFGPVAGYDPLDNFKVIGYDES